MYLGGWGGCNFQINCCYWKEAVKLSRSCHINKVWFPEKVKVLGQTNLIFNWRGGGGRSEHSLGEGLEYLCTHISLLWGKIHWPFLNFGIISNNFRPSVVNLRSGVIIFIIIIIIIIIIFFFASLARGGKNNTWYIYLISPPPPPNLHNLTTAWPVILLANQRLQDGNQIWARIMSLLKSILGKRKFLGTSMFRWRFVKKKFNVLFFWWNTACWSCRTFI